MLAFTMKTWNTVIICWLHFCCITFATSTNWTKPNGQFPSFTDTYTVGEKIIVSWLSLNASMNDLWLTRYNTTIDNFALRIGVSQDISTAGYFDWIVSLDTNEVAKDTRFILQFLPLDAAYNPAVNPLIPSPAFNLIQVNQQSPPNGTVSPSSTSSTSSIAVSTTSTTSSASPTSTQEPNTTGGTSLSLGTRVGIITGGTIGVLALFASMVYSMLVYRRYQRHRTSHLAAEEKVIGPYEVLGDRKHPIELGSQTANIHELNASSDMISEAGSTLIHEMGTINKRPGLHELPS